LQSRQSSKASASKDEREIRKSNHHYGGNRCHRSVCCRVGDSASQAGTSSDVFGRLADTRTAAEEKKRVWPIMTAQWPDYDKYQAGTKRDIPVVLLTPR